MINRKDGVNGITNKPLHIYLAGPYTAPTKEKREENVNRAIEVAIALYKKGHFPFVPHLSHYIDCYQTERPFLGWSNYMCCDLSWLKCSQALYFIGHSRGADIELEAAYEDGLDIYYTLSEVPDVCGTLYESGEVKEKKWITR